MANNLQWYGPNIGSSWDKTRIYRSDSESGSYTLIGEVPVTTTAFFDIDGLASNWYKITFYDSVEDIESPFSEPFFANSVAKFYTNPTELRKFMQFDKEDFPDDESVTLLIEQAHVQMADDAVGIGYEPKLKLLAMLLSSSFVYRSLASRALSKGYVAVNLEGVNIMKAHDALMRLSEYYFDKYQEQLAKDTVEFAITTYLTNSVTPEVLQDIKAIMNGVSDARDFGSVFMPSVQRRKGRYF